MTRGILALVLLVSLCGCACAQALSGMPYYAPRKDVTIAEAVAAFNERAKLDPIGATQPPLTVDEVVAAIRGWIPGEHPYCEAFLPQFKRVAETGILPEGTYLDFIPGWKGYNGYDYRVWWIDLFVPGHGKMKNGVNILGYNFRLRAQMISSKPHTSGH